jgi:hypothetical protein
MLAPALMPISACTPCICDNTKNTKRKPHERRTRTEIYQQGFLKIVKFPSWHDRAARRHGRTEPEQPGVLEDPSTWNVCRKNW